ncbi:hypothetical protein ACLH0B_22225, partial [Aeromonas salmonicida]
PPPHPTTARRGSAAPPHPSHTVAGYGAGRVLSPSPAAAVTPAMLAALYAGDQEALPCIG